MIPSAIGLTLAPSALAVPCSELNLPNPIYGAGGSAITATLGRVASALAGLPEPITILFADPGACIAWLQSLANPDGGFSDRPGWLSNPTATYYALGALKTLDAAERRKFIEDEITFTDGTSGKQTAEFILTVLNK